VKVAASAVNTNEDSCPPLADRWHAVRYAAKLDTVRLHDLRHSFASVSAIDSESLLVIRSLLGHKNVAATERYAHLGDDPVKATADRASGGIAAWLGSGAENS